MTIPLVAIAAVLLASPSSAADPRVDALRDTLAQAFMNQPGAPANVTLLPDIEGQCTALLNSGAPGSEITALAAAANEARIVQRGRGARSTIEEYRLLIAAAAEGLGIRPGTRAVPIYEGRPLISGINNTEQRALNNLRTRISPDRLAAAGGRARVMAGALTGSGRTDTLLASGNRFDVTSPLDSNGRFRARYVPGASFTPAQVTAYAASLNAQPIAPAYSLARPVTVPPAGPPRDPPGLMARLRGFYDGARDTLADARTSVSAAWAENPVNTALTDLQSLFSNGDTRLSLLPPSGVLAGLRVLRPHNSWGSMLMIAMLRVLGVELHARGMRVDVEDISRRSGLGRLAGHKSHRRGVDVDINLIGGPAGGGNRQNTLLLALIAKSARVTGSGLVYVFSINSHMRGYRQIMPQLVREGLVEQVDADAALRALNDEVNHHDHFHVRTAR